MNSEVINILRESKLCKGLDEEQLEFFYSHGNKVLFNINETIIQESQKVSSLFIILKGQVDVVLPRKDEYLMIERFSKIKLNKLTQGDCIGEYSLIDNKPASATVIVTQPSELFRVSQSDFQKMVDSNDRLARVIYHNLLKILIQRARDTNSELDLCIWG